MKLLQGVGVSPGVAMGMLWFSNCGVDPQPQGAVPDAEEEVGRFEAARSEAMRQLSELYAESKTRMGDETALLFQIHQMMLDDLDYRDAVTDMIREKSVNAAYAVEQVGIIFSQRFAQMDDDYMKGRAVDVQDVSQRVLRILSGKEYLAVLPDEKYIIAATDMTPSETAQLDCDKVLGFITSLGSFNAHSAIFARTMGLPAVVGLGNTSLEELSGKQAIIDGTTGEIFIDPDENAIALFNRRREKEDAHHLYLDSFRGLEVVTPQGRRLSFCANIGAPEDMNAVLQSDADGIGLLRSEFLYLGRDDYPTEEELYQAYKSIASAMNGKTVVIRTLDIGADKQTRYFGLPKEENPALGMRAIRICLNQKEVFHTQLRAIYRASAFGKVAIMFPMITSVNEVRKAKEACACAVRELELENHHIDRDVAVGIMIETPAAAVISDLLAMEVDFFSIGTNDLTQYTLAMDRQNAHLEAFCDRHHEAVIRLIRTTVDNAHRAGIRVGICGELAADKEMTKTFMEIDVDELSMAPGAILDVKASILSKVK